MTFNDVNNIISTCALGRHVSYLVGAVLVLDSQVIFRGWRHHSHDSSCPYHSKLLQKHLSAECLERGSWEAWLAVWRSLSGDLGCNQVEWMSGVWLESHVDAVDAAWPEQGWMMKKLWITTPSSNMNPQSTICVSLSKTLCMVVSTNRVFLRLCQWCVVVVMTQ